MHILLESYIKLGRSRIEAGAGVFIFQQSSVVIMEESVFLLNACFFNTNVMVF